MDDIAKEAGFTKPILYQYFESKTDLYHEIVTVTAQKLIDKLASAVSIADTPRAKIEVAFKVYFDMVVSETDAFRILFIHSHEGSTSGDLRNVELTLVSFLEPFIDISISKEHRRQLAAGVVGIAEGARSSGSSSKMRRLAHARARGVESTRRAHRHARVGWSARRPARLVPDNRHEGLR